MRVHTQALITAALVGCSSPATPTAVPTPTATTAATDAGVATDGAQSAAPALPPGTTMKLELKKPASLGDGGGRIELASYVAEQIAASPDGAYPAGSGVVLGLVVEGQRVELSELSAGYTSKKIAWTYDYRVELVSLGSQPPTATVIVHRIGDRVEPPILDGATVDRGQRLEIDRELTLEFRGHSHKSVMAGQQSPLIVLVTHHTQDGAHEDTHNLYPDDMRWRFRDYELSISSHKYDRSMTMTAHKRALVPLK